MIKDFKELMKLRAIPNLTTLYVEKNPFCVKIPTYMAKVKHLFPQLAQIDAELISGNLSA